MYTRYHSRARRFDQFLSTDFINSRSIDGREFGLLYPRQHGWTGQVRSNWSQIKNKIRNSKLLEVCCSPRIWVSQTYAGPHSGCGVVFMRVPSITVHDVVYNILLKYMISSHSIGPSTITSRTAPIGRCTSAVTQERWWCGPFIDVRLMTVEFSTDQSKSFALLG